jgi:hypothetical protein
MVMMNKIGFKVFGPTVPKPESGVLGASRMKV